VLGGGMTAVDAAVQAKKLGAEQVCIAYRRGPQQLSASTDEQRWAQVNGVNIRCWSAAKEILWHNGQVCGVRFVRTELHNGSLVETSESFVLGADMVLKAIGQSMVPEPLQQKIRLCNGRIEVDEMQRTSLPGVWAGGDCCAAGQDLTVQAVEHGKRAAASIHQALKQAIHQATN
jgi:dihydropyrimidine dehydrogenase (NAD+) subunit PreT